MCPNRLVVSRGHVVMCPNQLVVSRGHVVMWPNDFSLWRSHSLRIMVSVASYSHVVMSRDGASSSVSAKH